MNHPTSTIRAVLFDADGVVQRTKPGWLDELARLSGRADGAETFLQDVFDAEAPCLLGEVDFEQSLSAVLQKWKSPATLQEALRVWTMIEPDESVLALIRAIRSSGTSVALATNQQRHRADFMLNDLGYIHEFDHILCSCFIGHAKPGVQYFHESVKLLGLPPNELLFIDDHEGNVESARAAGLQSETFHLDDGLDVLERILQSFGLALPQAGR